MVIVVDRTPTSTEQAQEIWSQELVDMLLHHTRESANCSSRSSVAEINIALDICSKAMTLLQTRLSYLERTLSTTEVAYKSEHLSEEGGNDEREVTGADDATTTKRNEYQQLVTHLNSTLVRVSKEHHQRGSSAKYSALKKAKCVPPSLFTSFSRISSPNLRIQKQNLFLGYICKYLEVAELVKLRLSSKTNHLLLMEYPIDLSTLKNNTISPFELVRMICPLRLHTSSRLHPPLKSHLVSKEEKEASSIPCEEPSLNGKCISTSSSSVSNSSNKASETVSLHIVVDKNQAFDMIKVGTVINPIDFEAATLDNLKAHNVDRPWNVTGLSLDNLYSLNTFQALIELLKSFNAHKSVKKICFGSSNLLAFCVAGGRGNSNADMILNCIVKNFPQLEEFCWHGSTVPIGDMMEFQHLRNLKVLRLCGVNNISGDLKWISHLHDLEILELEHNVGVYGNISHLSNLNKLKLLKLNDLKTCGSLSSISKLLKLKQIEISNTIISGNISHLSKLHHMTDLIFENLDGVEGNIDCLIKLRKLQQLSIVNCDSVGGDISCLNKLKKLQRIELSETRVYGKYSSLRQGAHGSLKHLTHVDFEGSSVIDDESSGANTSDGLELDMRSMVFGEEHMRLSNDIDKKIDS